VPHSTWYRLPSVRTMIWPSAPGQKTVSVRAADGVAPDGADVTVEGADEKIGRGDAVVTDFNLAPQMLLA